MNRFMYYVGRVRKALTAALGSAATGYVNANVDGMVTKDEWAYIIGMGILTAVIVWSIPNKEKEKQTVNNEYAE